MKRNFILFCLLYPVLFFAQQNELLAHLTKNNPELRAYYILRNVIKNKKKNHPIHLKSYQYFLYNKFYIDDLMYKYSTNIDSITAPSFPFHKELLFLGERVTKFQYDKKYGTKNTIIANQVSGLKKPFYQLLNEQIYEDEFPDILNDNFFSYHFKLIDSVTINQNKTYVITFGSKKNLLINGSSGFLYIDSKSYAIVKYSGTEYNQNFTRYFELNWKPYKDIWYLKSCINKIKCTNTRTRFFDKNLQKNKLITPWIIIESTIVNFSGLKNLSGNNFKGYTYELEKDFDKDTEIKISPFRPQPLNNAEKQTYTSSSSIFDLHPIEKNIRTFLSLKEGELALGKFNFNLLNLLSYNDYEGFRIQLGGKTNYKMSQNYSLHGYAAFGSKDTDFKGNAGIDFFVNKKNDSKLSLNVYSDVNPFSREIKRGSETITEDKEKLNFIQNNLFYSYRKGEISYNQDFFKKFSTSFILDYATQKTDYPYTYKEYNAKHWFNNLTSSIQIKYSPFAEYMMTPAGKLTIKNKPVHFFLNYTKGWKEANGDFNYNKFDFSSDISIKSSWGNSDLFLSSGYISGKTALWNLYGSFGNTKNANTVLRRFSVKGFHSFETLAPGDFFADKYMAFFFIHNFKDIRLWGAKNLYISLLYNGMIGDMQHKDLHSSINFRTPSQYYQEIGLEFNRLIYYLGLGVYYRIGAYNEGNFNDNLFIKLTFNLF